MKQVPSKNADTIQIHTILQSTFMWQLVRRLFFITILSSHSCKFKRDRWLQSSVHNFSLTLPNPLQPLTSEDTTFLRVLTFNHSSVFWTQYSSSWIIRGGWPVWQWVFYEITFELTMISLSQFPVTDLWLRYHSLTHSLCVQVFWCLWLTEGRERKRKWRTRKATWIKN